MKTCSRCKEEKELSEFYINKQSKGGFRKECKICKNKVQKNWELKNKENRIEYYKKYHINNKEKKCKLTSEWLLNNKEKRNEWQRQYENNKRLNNPLFKLQVNTRTNIISAIKRQGYTKKTKTYEILGCTYDEFKIHLEKQFTKGMTWENQGEWHLDHIYPTSLAKDEEELIRLNYYTNFQPLWAIDNLKKGNKIIEKQLTLI
jgi:hypothetical protein